MKSHAHTNAPAYTYSFVYITLPNVAHHVCANAVSIFGNLYNANPSCNLHETWSSCEPNSYMRQLCAQGYYGPVCSLCVTSGDQRYGRVGSLQCKPCRSTAAIIGAYVASALGVLAWLSYTVHVTLVENEEAAAGHNDPQRTSQLIRVCCPDYPDSEVTLITFVDSSQSLNALPGLAC